ncbi:hypothetical protein [Chryseobacterium sediminis]|uniref:PD(D/E)XK endonuclease domain-containing protein n=1 Tax=Chryseobacterium sediminis TaxID=1679494 RepID=A0A5B2U8J6_9FLAO|nr:hypothetical protein [Chryseobacterium sediminis]KAA2222944.1 hypothetical protein FW780_01715 [Chryseobacterium sediminis]
MIKKIVRNADNNYNTNLASEYLIMSILCRTGKDAFLSLGNKKGVDIIVKTNLGAICIVEVKGVNKRNDWLITNSGTFTTAPNLIYALVCYNGKIDDLGSTPDFWFIPSIKLAENTEHKIAKNGKTVYISNKYVRENYTEYKNSTKYLEEYLNAF